MWRNSDLDAKLFAQRMAEERQRIGAIKIPIELDATSTVQLISQLQLALRHPDNTGPGSDLAKVLLRSLTRVLSEMGYEAHAELAAMGDPMTPRCAHCGVPLNGLQEAAAHECKARSAVVTQ